MNTHASRELPESDAYLEDGQCDDFWWPATTLPPPAPDPNPAPLPRQARGRTRTSGIPW
ncbi:hypothetical protein ACFWXK_25435 [Streptomyces sp. NPDC059070]|uniref:hypothetical protein n=1 Tax=unclassified Streptomyces TaxID=2593676 RepID=UPI0034E2C781